MGLYELGRDLTATVSQHLPARARSVFVANRRIFSEMLDHGGARGLRAEAHLLGIEGKWLTDAADAPDETLAARLAQTYVAMKAKQSTVEPKFRPHAIWQELLDRDWTEGRAAAHATNAFAFDSFLRNFFRNGGVSGVWGSGDMFRAFAEMSEWDELARLALFMRQMKAWRREAPEATIDDLAHGPVGNPWGYRIEGRPVVEPEFEYHELARRMRELLAPNAQPLILEIGGGYGGFAAQLVRQIPGVRYVGFDLPENVIIQSYHARRTFPDRAVHVNDLSGVGQPGSITLLPNWLLADPSVAQADLVVNVRSFAEMSAETLAEYFTQIRRIAPTWIYHENVAGQRGDHGHGISVTDYPPLPDYKLVAANESRWPRYDRHSAYPCREHILKRREAP